MSDSNQVLGSDYYGSYGLYKQELNVELLSSVFMLVVNV